MGFTSGEPNHRKQPKFLLAGGILSSLLLGLISPSLNSPHATPKAQQAGQASLAPTPHPLPRDAALRGELLLLPPAPQMHDEERLALVRPQDVLGDPLNRIDPLFEVPKELQERTAFWLDVYTKHGSFEHLIHHTLYPWIVFDVVDLGPEVESGRGPKWLRIERAKKKLTGRKKEIREALWRLAKKTSPRQLTGLELELSTKLKDVRGHRSKVYIEAANSLRTQLGQKDFFIGGLRRSSRYLAYMEQIFLDLGVPVELTRMPFVESSFNERAESKVGASGVWQIMPYTGRAYLFVNDKIDERNSPLKATLVAARLLKSYRRSLKSWPLAVTAYNHGIGNIQKAIRAAQSKDLPTIIRRYHQGDFRFASANFYTSFLAALYAEKYSEVLFPAVARDRLLEVEQITLTQATPWHKIKRSLGLSHRELLQYNQDLRRADLAQLRLPRGYVLHVPPGLASELGEKPRAGAKPFLPPAARVSDNTPTESLSRSESI